MPGFQSHPNCCGVSHITGWAGKGAKFEQIAHDAADIVDKIVNRKGDFPDRRMEIIMNLSQVEANKELIKVLARLGFVLIESWGNPVHANKQLFLFSRCGTRFSLSKADLPFEWPGLTSRKKLVGTLPKHEGIKIDPKEFKPPQSSPRLDPFFKGYSDIDWDAPLFLENGVPCALRDSDSIGRETVVIIYGARENNQPQTVNGRTMAGRAGSRWAHCLKTGMWAFDNRYMAVCNEHHLKTIKPMEEPPAPKIKTFEDLHKMLDDAGIHYEYKEGEE